MNVASLKLCEELYDLSGWVADTIHPETNGLIGYSLGFLLRKLNATAYIELRTRGNQQDAWVCVYEAHKDTGETRRAEQAVTPEDAACKLAIELIKEGVIS